MTVQIKVDQSGIRSAAQPNLFKSGKLFSKYQLWLPATEFRKPSYL